jgi:UDP-glucose 4-epimerase
MNLLLTGASGFLGKNLLLGKEPDWKIYALYHNAKDFPSFVRSRRLIGVVPLRCDLTSADAVRGLLAEVPERLDAIIHLAANGDPAHSVSDPRGDLMAGPVSLVTLLTVFQCSRFVYFSSGAIYDRLKGPVGPDTPVNPTLPYAISKLACERYVRHFRKSGRIGNYAILRFFGAYGPHEPERKLYSRLVRWALAAGDEPYEIRGDGKNLIDAMYVSDVVRGVKQVLRSQVADEVVDFASGAPITVNEVVMRAAKILRGRDANIRHVGIVPEYIEFFVSTEKMEQLFGFRPEVPLEDGLIRLKEHLMEMETVR